MNSFAKYRIIAGYTQCTAADSLHIDPSTVAKWETNKAKPRSGLLLRVANLYHCSVDQLLRDEGAEGVKSVG